MMTTEGTGANAAACNALVANWFTIARAVWKLLTEQLRTNQLLEALLAAQGVSVPEPKAASRPRDDHACRRDNNSYSDLAKARQAVELRYGLCPSTAGAWAADRKLVERRLTTGRVTWARWATEARAKARAPAKRKGIERPGAETLFV